MLTHMEPEEDKVVRKEAQICQEKKQHDDTLGVQEKHCQEAVQRLRSSIESFWRINILAICDAR